MKAKKIYQCNSCNAQSHKWQGQCFDCNEWNSFTEVIIEASAKKAFSNYAGERNNLIQDFADINVEENIKISTLLDEFDRTLGGGLVLGSVILLGGDPGIGKSTLLLQALINLSNNYNTLYVTGEESLQQVVMRGKRLSSKTPNIKLLSEINIEAIVKACDNCKPNIVIIDSIQTIYSLTISSSPGSVSQVRECTSQLTKYAKQTNTAIFIVGHVTKEGAIAGPRILEHMVDTVLYFEGNTNNQFRALRTCKNRFGAVNELGIFAMTEHGLNEINNPSAIFLANNYQEKAGSIITVTWEGTRPMLIEIQALVDKSYLENPRRMAVGVDPQRLAMILAVLNKHVGIFTHDQDIFINVVGGVKISETAIDLAIAMAIISSLHNKIIKKDIIAFGEIGLAGELRPASNAKLRLKEAEKLGFTEAYIPKANLPKGKYQNLKVHISDSLKNICQDIC